MAAVYQKQPDLDQQDLEAGDFKPAAIASANDLTCGYHWPLGTENNQNT